MNLIFEPTAEAGVCHDVADTRVTPLVSRKSAMNLFFCQPTAEAGVCHIVADTWVTPLVSRKSANLFFVLA